MKKNCLNFIGMLFVCICASLFFTGCSMVRDLTYIKQKAVGVDNVETQEELEKDITVKSKNIKNDGVQVKQYVIYTPEVGYDAISKEERLKYSSKTDKKYGLFRYRLYYDYLIPDKVQIFIDVDSNFYFHSAVDQSGVKFELIRGWPKNHLFGGTALYRELYTVYLPLKYVQSQKEKPAIVIDLLSDKEGVTNNLGTAFFDDNENLSRTFHIPQFYIKGFLNAIKKYDPANSEENKK